MLLIGIDPGAHHRPEFFESQFGGQTCVGVGSDVSRNERTENHAASQVVRGIDLLRLAQVRVSPDRIRRIGVTVIAAALRIHDITTQPDQCPIFAMEVQGHRSDLESLFNSVTLIALAFPELVSQ